jgi:hypothetical protein
MTRIPYPMIALILALPAESAAQPQPSTTRDPEAAEVLYQRARTAIEKNDFKTACPLFAESQRLDPGVGTLLNLANCEEKLGRLATALAHYREAQGSLKGDSRLAFATSKVTSLGERVPKLTLQLREAPPAGLTVLRDSVSLSSASLGIPLPVDPGAHLIVVKATGHDDKAYNIVLAEKDKRDLVLELGPLSATQSPAVVVPASAEGPPPAPAGSPGKTADANDSPPGGATIPAAPASDTTRLGFMIGFGAGAVLGVGTGITSALMASSDERTFKDGCRSSDICSDEAKSAKSRGQALNIVTPIAFGVGAVSAGLFLYFAIKGPATKKTAGLWVTPSLDGVSRGMVLSGRF